MDHYAWDVPRDKKDLSYAALAGALIAVVAFGAYHLGKFERCEKLNEKQYCIQTEKTPQELYKQQLEKYLPKK